MTTDTGERERGAAAAYKAARDLPPTSLEAWREAVTRHANPRPGMTLLDVGAGTGGFASAFRSWFGVDVVAVEPAEAMRALIPAGDGVDVREGRAEELPVADGTADVAWLGSVVHHITDLTAAARELRRVLRPGAPVLIRNAFPGRCERDLRIRFFPETATTVAAYPTVEAVTEAFATAGFRRTALEPVPHTAAPTLAAWADTLHRASDAKLRALPDEAWSAGLTRIRAEAAANAGVPAVSWMDLMVLV